MSLRTRYVVIALVVLAALIVAVVMLSSDTAGPDVDPNHPMPLF
jgi:hypothetical protein